MSADKKKPPITPKRKTRHRTTRNPDNIIIETLHTQNHLPWAELLKQTNIGKATLNNHIDKLIEKKIVTTITDPNKPKTILYSLTYTPFTKEQEQDIKNIREKKKEPSTFLEKQENLRPINSYQYMSARRSALILGKWISTQQDTREEAKKVFNTFLDHATKHMIYNLFCVILEASTSSKGKDIVENIKQFGLTEDVKKSIFQLWGTYSKDFDVRAMAEIIFQFVFENPDLAFGVGGDDSEMQQRSFSLDMNWKVEKKIRELYPQFFKRA